LTKAGCQSAATFLIRVAVGGLGLTTGAFAHFFFGVTAITPVDNSIA